MQKTRIDGWNCARASPDWCGSFRELSKTHTVHRGLDNLVWLDPKNLTGDGHSSCLRVKSTDDALN